MPDRRYSLMTTIVPYVVLAILVGYMLLSRPPGDPALPVDLALCALTAAWMFVMFTLRPAWRGRPAVMALFYVGFVALTATLVLRDPAFGFLAIAGYAYAFTVLPWPWRLLGVAAMGVVAGTAQTSGVRLDAPLGLAVHVIVAGANALGICVVVWVLWNSDEQSRQRKVALEEVSEANRRLEATMAENTRLHEQLVAQAREAGVRDERERMAREIHDTLAQGLAGIITQLQAAEQAGAAAPGWQQHVTAAVMLARESLTEARRSVHALRPEPLETGRLGDAVADVAARWAALHGIPVQVTTTGTARPLRPESEVALLRTAQEALANVAKHAQATRVGVTLSYLEHEVALDVRDDGGGFDTAGLAAPQAADREGGFGLLAMRQRIEGLEGTLQVESEPGSGTAISACVPAAPARAGA